MKTLIPTTGILLFTALLALSIHHSETLLRWLTPPPLPAPKLAGPNEVVLYSTTWCGYCAKTRQYFKENNISYIDLDVEHSARGRADYQQWGARGVPVVIINHKTLIRGYAPAEMYSALNVNAR